MIAIDACDGPHIAIHREVHRTKGTACRRLAIQEFSPQLIAVGGVSPLAAFHSSEQHRCLGPQVRFRKYSRTLLKPAYARRGECPLFFLTQLREVLIFS